MPPSAAMIGRDARLMLESSPSTSSRLISRPTTKKKNVISKSLTQCWTLSSTPSRPGQGKAQSSVILLCWMSK